VSEAGFEPILRLNYFHLHNWRVLIAFSGHLAPHRTTTVARGLLKQDGERWIGPLLIGKAPTVRLPDTHVAH
jgi:hypothetical protein